eukprot:3270010-Prymnesium_polylepis.1
MVLISGEGGRRETVEAAELLREERSQSGSLGTICSSSCSKSNDSAPDACRTVRNILPVGRGAET